MKNLHIEANDAIPNPHVCIPMFKAKLRWDSFQYGDAV